MKYLYLLLTLAVLFYVTKNFALSAVFAGLSALFFFRGKAGSEYFTLEPIQDNTVPYRTDTEKKSNKLKEYVPYTISPYLEVPYMNKNILGNDPAGLKNLAIDTEYPPTDMNPFKYNKAYPEACLEGNAMFSTDMGCIKLKPDQVRYISSRGHNMDKDHSFI
jgi:hypothetical protein